MRARHTVQHGVGRRENVFVAKPGARTGQQRGGSLEHGDRLVVGELSRLGRSLGQIAAILDALAKAGVAFVALKENIRVEGKRDIQTKVMTTLFALSAEAERDLISERTREGLAKARASGQKLGRPKGSLGVSKTAIAKITGVSRPTLYSFMSTRGLRTPA